MKMDRVASSQNDEFYTPAYAIQPILKYVPPGASVWCPFDTEDSQFVKSFRAHGCSVVATHLVQGQDFFTTTDPGCEFVISNPPYTLKGKVLEKLFALDKRFAMLVGVVGLFESQHRFQMFKANRFEILYLSKRVAYFKDYNDPQPSIHPPFSSVYVCRDVLPKPITFEEITRS